MAGRNDADGARDVAATCRIGSRIIDHVYGNQDDDDHETN